MKNLLKISIIGIILFIIISVPVFAKTGKIVNTQQVRFRAKAAATEDSEILGQVKKDEKVEILEQIEGWYKVKYDGKTGYINDAYIEVIADEPVVSTQTPEQTTTTPTQEISNNQTTTENVYKTLGNVSVRLMPLINSNVLTTLEKDVQCTVIEKAGKWSYIETTTIKGWVVTKSLTEGAADVLSTSTTVEPQQTSASTTKKGYVNTSEINVRKGPSTSSELVKKLSLNTEVTIVGEDGDWYQVELDGQKVYIYKPLISDSKK